MIKLPEGIGFTGFDFGTDNCPECTKIANLATAKLSALFEEWVKREGVKVFCQQMKYFGVNRCADDTHQAYLMLCEELK